MVDIRLFEPKIYIYIFKLLALRVQGQVSLPFSFSGQFLYSAAVPSNIGKMQKNDTHFRMINAHLDFNA